MIHGLIGPSLRVYRVPEGTKWLVFQDEHDENNSEGLLDILKGEALQIVIGEYSESVFIYPDKRVEK